MRVLIAAFLLAAGPAGSQQPAFRANVQLLEVDARVFDADGRFVEGLQIADFELLEEGQPQTIEALYFVGASVNAAASGSAASAKPLPRSSQTWIFVFDRKHLVPNGYRRAKVAVEAFMAGRFRAGDFAGIVADEKMIDDRITNVRAEFLASLSKVRMPGDASGRAADAEEARVTGGDGEAGDTIRSALMGLSGREVERAARDTTEMLDQLARGLLRQPGPKTIVLMSDGWGLGKLEATLRTTVQNMTRAGARVYAVDTRGIAGPPPDSLNTLANDTGGRVLFNINDLGPALDQIAADTNTYYVIGYQPANRKLDGKYRRIEVRVKRPGVRVHARRGYVAVKSR